MINHEKKFRKRKRKKWLNGNFEKFRGLKWKFNQIGKSELLVINWLKVKLEYVLLRTKPPLGSNWKNWKVEGLNYKISNFTERKGKDVTFTIYEFIFNIVSELWDMRLITSYDGEKIMQKIEKGKIVILYERVIWSFIKNFMIEIIFV